MSEAQTRFDGMSEEDRAEANRLLAMAVESQTRFWEDVGDLEKFLGVDIDSTLDLRDQTILSLLENAEAE
jgi:hypothetical protein